MNYKLLIRNVWADNLEQEMTIIRKIVLKYNYISMDTEFPGIVSKIPRSFMDESDYNYQMMKANVDVLKIIQLGFTFADCFGNYPENMPRTWQFHFHFDLETDMAAPDSIDLLERSGIDFHRHRLHGIKSQSFGSLFISSGMCCNPNVHWISFQGYYDFGYLIKILAGSSIPETSKGFENMLSVYFPQIYDTKFIMSSYYGTKGGLQDLADDLRVERIGPQHQAGSDSLLTCETFFKLKHRHSASWKDMVGKLQNLDIHVQVPQKRHINA